MSLLAKKAVIFSDSLNRKIAHAAISTDKIIAQIMFVFIVVLCLDDYCLMTSFFLNPTLYAV